MDTTQDWNHYEINARLHASGRSQAGIARDLDVSPVTVSAVVRGRTSSDRVQRAVAQALGMKPHEIWPSRYNPDGTVRRPGRPLGRGIK